MPMTAMFHVLTYIYVYIYIYIHIDIYIFIYIYRQPLNKLPQDIKSIQG